MLFQSLYDRAQQDLTALMSCTLALVVCHAGLGRRSLSVDGPLTA